MATQKYTSRTSPERIARIMAEQGVTESRAKQIARGHGATPEHGIETEARYRDRYVYTSKSSQAAMRQIRLAATDERRVSVAIFDKGYPNRPLHIWTNPGHSPGISARYLKSEIGRQNLKRYLEGVDFFAPGFRGPSPGTYRPQGITAILVTVYK